MRIIFSILLFLFLGTCFADEKVVNVYTWSGVIPDFLIQQFEKETGIKVNFSTYDSNEVMYAKLRANKNSGYDVIEPSSYYIDRMRRQKMLEPLNKSKLTNFKNLNPNLLNQAYDKNNLFSIPYMWGVTGIFVNKNEINANSLHTWNDFWDSKYANQLLLLDDSREVFSIALRTLGYSGNDNNPEHIKAAYEKLKTLMSNVKLFNSDAVISLLIDEDVNVGMVWNGDFYKANQENPNLAYIFPEDGFVIWVDNFAIPKGAPHLDNAHKFLNFMLRADVAKAAALDNGYPTPNLAGQKLMPPDAKNNPIVYPSAKILKRGEFQMDIGDDALALYEEYWEKLKMGG